MHNVPTTARPWPLACDPDSVCNPKAGHGSTPRLGVVPAPSKGPLGPGLEEMWPPPRGCPWWGEGQWSVLPSILPRSQLGETGELGPGGAVWGCGLYVRGLAPRALPGESGFLEGRARSCACRRDTGWRCLGLHSPGSLTRVTCLPSRSVREPAYQLVQLGCSCCPPLPGSHHKSGRVEGRTSRGRTGLLGGRRAATQLGSPSSSVGDGYPLPPDPAGAQNALDRAAHRAPSAHGSSRGGQSQWSPGASHCKP